MRSILRHYLTGILFCFILVSLGCKGKSDPAFDGDTGEANVEELYKGYYQDPSNIDEEQQNMIIDYAIEKDINLTRLESGLYFLETREGMGPNLRWGEEVKVHYVGTYLDGKEFDSSYRRDVPLKVSVGAAIAGWNEALIRLQSGSKAIIVVPSRLGYRDREYAGIPPNSVLVFELHVLI